MINRLKLEDICIINKVNQPEAKMYYLEFVETPSTDPNSYPLLGLHPVEKHFILDKKYVSNTNETILILDSCSGSGTLALSCLKLKRNFICIEKSQEYVDISNDRINKIFWE